MQVTGLPAADAPGTSYRTVSTPGVPPGSCRPCPTPLCPLPRHLPGRAGRRRRDSGESWSAAARGRRLIPVKPEGGKVPWAGGHERPDPIPAVSLTAPLRLALGGRIHQRNAPRFPTEVSRCSRRRRHPGAAGGRGSRGRERSWSSAIPRLSARCRREGFEGCSATPPSTRGCASLLGLLQEGLHPGNHV